MSYELKDYLNSININKTDVMQDLEAERKYPPYIVNKCLSGFMDTVLLANELNINPHLDNKLQYHFLLNIVRPKKRFSPWLKKEKLDDLEAVKSYYGYSNEKARAALRILDNEQLEQIKLKLTTGGKK